MPEKDIERALAKITEEILAYPHYNSKFPYSNISAQRLAVKGRLDALVEAKYVIELPVADHYNVIPYEDKEFSVYQDYGQSASDCLNASEQESQSVDDLLNSFLCAVKMQSLEVGAKIAKDERNAKSESEHNARFQEYIIDLNKRQEKLDTQAQNVQKTLNQLRETAQKVEASVNTAVAEAGKITNKVTRAKNAANSAKAKAKEAKATAKEVKATADNMIPNMLSVLGIFVGVVIAVVACYLTILLEENNSEAIAVASIPLAFMFAWMMGHILVMAIFMLLYMIAKLTDRTISCVCYRYNGEKNDIAHDCIKCQNNKGCNPAKRFKSRYPYVFWTNVIFIVGYVILGIVHIIDLYYAPRLNLWIRNHLVLFPIIVIGFIGAIILIIFVCRMVARQIRNNKS